MNHKKTWQEKSSPTGGRCVNPYHLHLLQCAKTQAGARCRPPKSAWLSRQTGPAGSLTRDTTGEAGSKSKRMSPALAADSRAEPAACSLAGDPWVQGQRETLPTVVPEDAKVSASALPAAPMEDTVRHAWRLAMPRPSSPRRSPS